MGMDMMVWTLTLTLTVKRGMRRTGRTGGGSSSDLGSSESESVVDLGRWGGVWLLTHLTSLICVLVMVSSVRMCVYRYRRCS
jgi:hypothetical protein